MNSARRALPLLAVLLAAGSLRVAVTVEHRSLPLFKSLRLDELAYDQWAREAMTGQWFAARPTVHAPGYAWLLAVIYKVMGYDLLWPRLLQLGLGLGTVMLTWRIADRLFGRAAGLCSALLIGLYWPLIVFEQRLLIASLFLFLNLAALLAALEWRERGSVIAAGLAGLLLGAAIVVYPVAAAWAAGLPIVTGLGGLGSARRRVIPMLLYTAVLGLIVGPAVAGCHVHTGQWYFLRGYGGFNLYLGNNPEADGTMYARLGGAWDKMEALPWREAGAVTSAEQDRAYAAAVGRFIREDPGAFLAGLGRKALLVLNRREVRATIDPEFQRGLFPALKLPLPGFTLILGLALAGLPALRRARAGGWVLALYALTYSGNMLATVVSSRYRLPVTAALAVLAGAGVMELAAAARAWRRGGFRPLGKALAAPLLLAAGLALAWLPVAPTYGPAEEYTYVGYSWYEKGDYAQARQWYERALAADPGYAMAMIELARLTNAEGKVADAVSWEERAVHTDPDGGYGHFNLGQYYGALGRPEEALAQYEAAVGAKPLWDDALYQFGKNALELKRWDEAEMALTRLRRVRPDFYDRIDPLLGRIIEERAAAKERAQRAPE